MVCLKSAAKKAVPSENVRTGIRNLLWKDDPKVNMAKQKAKFWLRMWPSSLWFSPSNKAENQTRVQVFPA